jgi:hypothetical protein
MEETVDNGLMLEALDRTLEAYGADAARWPEASRLKLSAFVAGNGEAQKRVADARALDRVLGFAPRFSDAQNTALAGRIVAKAGHQPRIITEAAKAPLSRQWSSGRGSQGLAGAALAASLLLGIIAGQSADLATLSEVFASGQQVAQGEEADTLTDEDLL